jgi:hypothetical protein
VTAPVQTLIIGAGPAGTAVLSAADKNGCLPDLVSAGLVMVDRADHVGDGLIGRYTINSDSTSETFLTQVNQSRIEAIRALEDHPAVQAIAAHIGDLGAPLPKAGVFLGLVGQYLTGFVQDNGGSVMTGHEVLYAQQVTDGLWRTRIRCLTDGSESEIVSHAVVIATGGHQPESLIAEKIVAGVPVASRYPDKLLRSDVFCAHNGLARAREIVAGRANPRVAVLGGSTSAMAAANKLLKPDGGFDFGAGAISLLYRRPLRPFYPSIEAAHAEGFTDFGPDDICPVSGFVYRLAGFRLEARALVVKLLGIGDAEPEPCVQLHQIAGDDDGEAVRIMDEADLIIAALGYRPHAIPLRDRDGHALPIAAHLPHHPPMVDGACRVVGADGEPVAGLYGIGLAAGFVPHGRLGGEPSFRGQANGLWLWQNDVGQLIVDQLLAEAKPARAVA